MHSAVVAMAKKSLFLVVVVVLVSNCFQAQVLPLDEDSSTLLSGSVYTELEVNLTAEEVWAVYSSPDLPFLIMDLQPNTFKSIVILSGDGGEGTVLNVTTLPNDKDWPVNGIEKITKIDDTNRIRRVASIAGGLFDIGYVARERIFKVSSKGPKSCIIGTTTTFTIKDGYESSASFNTISWGMAKEIIDYIRQNKAKNFLASKAFGS